MREGESYWDGVKRKGVKAYKFEKKSTRQESCADEHGGGEPEPETAPGVRGRETEIKDM